MELRPYQHIALDHFAAHRRCALWADMGLGKTVSTLTHLDRSAALGEGPALVLAPRRVAAETWPAEAKKWGFDEVAAIVGDEKARLRALKLNRGVYTTNYEQIPWLVDHLGDRWPFKTIVADEATRLKGFRLRKGTKRARALAHVAHKKAAQLIELTGTPAPNGLIDLWGQMWFIDGGRRLGRTFTAFEERWFTTGYDGYSTVPLPHAFDEITERCKDVCLSIRAKDWFDLNDPIVVRVPVQLPAKVREQYRKLERALFVQMKDGTVTAVNAAAKSQKLLQMASGAVYLDADGEESHKLEWEEVHDAKLDALGSIIEERAGAPLLVVYHFRSDLARIRRAFPAARTLDDGPDMVQAWNRGNVPLLLVHPQSAGHGLNLQQGGNAIAFFSHWWDLETRQQVIERIGPVRQAQAGLDRNVFIYNIVAEDTLDDVVIERVEGKTAVQDALAAYMKRRK